MSSSPTSLSSSDIDEPSPYDAFGALRCAVEVILGTSRITVRRCLALEPRVILRLTESAGEDLRVVVNGVPIARAEVAIIDTSTAVRITDFNTAPAERGL